MKRLMILFACMFMISAELWNQTKPIVPRADTEGAIGVPILKWGFGYFRGLHGDTLYWTTLSPAITASSLGAVTGTPWTSMGYLTSYTETDPTIYAWAKASVKPTYSYNEVGAQPSGTYLIPSDTTAERTFSNLKYQAKATYLVPSDSTAQRTFTNLQLGLKQNAGTYLIPSDSTAQRTFTNLQLALKQIAGTYLIPSDSTAQRTFTNLQLATKSALVHSHAESDITNLTTDLAAKAPLASPTFTGTPAAPTAAVSTNTTQIATTAFVLGQVGTANPLTDGSVAVGTSLLYSRQDHVHPTDATRAPLASPTLTGTPNIAAATGTSLAVTGALTSSGGGVGYITGAGGTVTQASSRTTGVTLNKLCGTITMFSAAQAADAIVTFTLTDSFITATDFIDIQHISATNGGAWNFSVVCAAGSCTITVRNVSNASITEATPLRFLIHKASTN